MSCLPSASPPMSAVTRYCARMNYECRERLRCVTATSIVTAYPQVHFGKGSNVEKNVMVIEPTSLRARTQDHCARCGRKGSSFREVRHAVDRTLAAHRRESFPDF